MIPSRNTTMKHISKRWVATTCARFLILFTFFTLVACYPAPYREFPRSVPENAGVSSKAPLTQVYFYPKAGQTTQQQSRDHYECYTWAVKQSSFDPSQTSIPPERRVKVVPMPPPGHDTAVLAVAGAVLGALIAGPRHAGAGALIGAGSGAIAGAASDASRQQYAQQMQEAYANRDQALDAQQYEVAHAFRRAMSACLEGRGYSVK
jgi:outer membrane lipoprotein SlyB